MKFCTLALSGLIAAVSVLAKARTPVDATTYAALSKYPAYTNAIYISPFTIPCIWPYNSILVKYINNTFSDTQVGILRNDADKEIILAIPGANSTFDTFTIANFEPVPYVASNIFCPLCHVHGGFLNAWNSISSETESAIRSQLAIYPNYKVVIAGHSLGGAICGLAYPSLTAAKLPIKAAYCSGSPRVGDALFANYIDSLSGASDTNPGNYYRITHYNDGVPQAPAIALGYLHPRTEWFEAAYNSTLSQTYRCYGQEASDCNLSLGPGQFINNAHQTYAGVRYDCNNGFFPNPCETCPYFSSEG